MSTYNIVFSKSLIHYGIPKMVHGVRRFQYPDGSLTPEGRIRYGREKQKILSTRDHPDDPSEIAKAERQAMAQVPDWGKEDIRNTNEVWSKAKSAVDSAGSTMDKWAAAGSKRDPWNSGSGRKPLDLHTMTDQELRAAIDRKLLEDRFNSMFNVDTKAIARQERIEKGKAFMSAVSATVGLAGGVVGLALAIQQMKDG